MTEPLDIARVHPRAIGNRHSIGLDHTTISLGKSDIVATSITHRISIGRGPRYFCIVFIPFIYTRKRRIGKCRSQCDGLRGTLHLSFSTRDSEQASRVALGDLDHIGSKRTSTRCGSCYLIVSRLSNIVSSSRSPCDGHFPLIPLIGKGIGSTIFDLCLKCSGNTCTDFTRRSPLDLEYHRA